MFDLTGKGFEVNVMRKIENKKIQNVEPSFVGIMHNQKDWVIKE